MPKRRRLSKGARNGAKVGLGYGIAVSRVKGHNLKLGAKVTAGTVAAGMLVGHGTHMYKQRGGRGMRNQAPIQSKAATGAGFKKGMDNMLKASRSSTPIPGTKNVGMKPRKGVWHPGASKP